MKILVTGASGSLGYAISKLLTVADVHEVVGTYFSNQRTGCANSRQLDLCDNGAVLAVVTEVQPDVVINAAVSDASADITQTIALSAKNIIDAANDVNALLVGFSTDLIFDGSNAPYPEDATPSPWNDYGRAKAAADQLHLSSTNRLTLVRTSLIYDFTKKSRQVGWMIKKIEVGEKVPLFVDEVRQPIWGWNLADAVIELAGKQAMGVINVAGPESLSRYEYGIKLLEALGYDHSTHVEGVKASVVAPHRPQNATLVLDKAATTLKTPLASFDQASSIWRKNPGDFQ